MTRELVAAALADPERRRLVALLEADPSTTPPRKPSPRTLERRARAQSEAGARLLGELKGFAEGIVAGEHRGRVDTLLKQLGKRFGPVPAATKAKIRRAERATLSRWLLRVLTAPSIEAVLDGRRTLSGPRPRSAGRSPSARSYGPEPQDTAPP